MTERLDDQGHGDKPHDPGKTDLVGIAYRIAKQREMLLNDTLGFFVMLYYHESIDVEAALRSARSAAVACEGSKAYQVAEMEGAPLYVPVCADHAQTWFTERDHLHGGMDAACIVCAHVTQSASEPFLTDVCDELFGCFLDHGGEDGYRCAICERSIPIGAWVHAAHDEGCIIPKVREYLAQHRPSSVPPKENATMAPADRKANR